MCKKCNKSSCGGCGSSSSTSEVGQLQNQLAELQDTVDVLVDNAKFLLKGHPILLIDNIDDINQFDLSTGVGFSTWEGWAICNGQTHLSKSTKKNITTPNFVDRFIVQATGNYAVGDTGGADSVTLDLTQIPAHDHGITDPGHAHDITDPGHIHPIQDDMHTHQSTSAPHVHHVTLDGGGHLHAHTAFDAGGDSYNIGAGTAADVGNYSDNLTGGEHSHDGYTDSSPVAITNDPAATGIEVLNALTGITETETVTTGISTDNNGGGLAHENRPPFYASLYIMKI